MDKVKTLGALLKTGYQSVSVKDELRKNLLEKLRNNDRIFDGVLGFDHTVIPDIERAILSRHNIILLGLRGQAKTRLARLMIQLLDEYIPAIKGSEINDDPLHPISKFGRDIISEMGEDTPLEWIHKEERYVEKLATPDVSVADLIGDVDPIKAATLKLPYSDERVIHFGLIPRAHRGIFVINELPDLQARIQVSLFNILQEGDLQIRGFKLRLPLQIQFVFTANPEDYTNRGSIITPLKDRIESQILTHYPTDISIAKEITRQESKLAPEQVELVEIPDLLTDLLETISFKARESELIDDKSGVSARLGISAYENLVSTAERRMIRNKEESGKTRITDFWGIIPSITGKVELVYEGEQEGPYNVALKLIGEAVKELFLERFTHPDKLKKGEQSDPYGVIRAWFSAGNTLDLPTDLSSTDYTHALHSVAGLQKFVEQYGKRNEDQLLQMELVLHGLSEFSVISKDVMVSSLSFSDPLAGIMDDIDDEEY